MGWLGALLSLGLAWAGDAPGRAAFEAHGCRSCHRAGGPGGNAGPDLALVGVRRSPEWLELWLKRPSAWKKDTLMPDPRLPDGDRAALVSFLASLKGPEASPGGLPWDAPAARRDPALRGRLIYARAGCAACHGPRGEGGHPNTNVPGGRIPALSALAATYTLDELKARIRRGSKPDKEDPAGPEPLVAMPAWGGLLDEDGLTAVARHVLSLAKTEKEDW